MSIEEEIIEHLQASDDWRAKRAASWVKAYGNISMAYAEYTGGHIDLDALHQVLTENCFGA